MKTYKQLTEEYKKAVEELQESCKHEDVSDWMQEWWALAHSTRYSVRVCNICRKVVDRRTRCNGCSKVFNVRDLKEPTDPNVAINTLWCEECYPKHRQIDRQQRLGTKRNV